MADKKAVENTAVKADAKTEKSKKDTAKKVPFFTKAKNWFKNIAKYFRDTKSELKKVVWPSKKQTRTNTITVIVVVVIAAVVMILLDVIFGGAIHLMVG
ncbi:MAG: preprotein translocase subunit SecE [Gemmiger sp.]|nr:preprotein translocase subunit SecE [Gemmiger sp.]